MVAQAMLVALSLSQTMPRQTNGNGVCLWQPGRTFTWAVDFGGDTDFDAGSGLNALVKAQDAWLMSIDACSGWTFGAPVVVTDAGIANDGQNTIVVRTRLCDSVVPQNDPCIALGTCGNAYHCWNNGPLAISLPTVSYLQTTGEILDVDIELNGQSFLFTTVDSPPCVSPNFNPSCVATDLQSVLTSSTGFALGLAYVQDQSSVMKSASPPGSLNRVVDNNSALALCAAYPLDQPATDCSGNPADAGSGGGAGGGSGSDGGTGGGSATGGGTGGGGSNTGGGGTSGGCGPVTCAGCCDALGVCQPGSAVTACGAHGGICQSCAGSEECLVSVCSVPPKTGCGCNTVEWAFLPSLLVLTALRRAGARSRRPSAAARS